MFSLHTLSDHFVTDEEMCFGLHARCCYIFDNQPSRTDSLKNLVSGFAYRSSAEAAIQTESVRVFVGNNESKSIVVLWDLKAFSQLSVGCAIEPAFGHCPKLMHCCLAQ